MMKKILIFSITLSLVFLSCKKTDDNSFTHRYILYSQKIAEIIDEKIKNIDNLHIYPFFVNEELKAELIKYDYKNPSKETILIYKYSETGPLPYSIEIEDILPDTLKKDRYKNAFFSIIDAFDLRVSDESFIPTHSFDTYDLFVDNKLLKQPAICILEYEEAYPIVIFFVTGENGAVLTKSTIVFDKKINQESITSGLLWDNLELDGMYVVPLKNKQY